MDKSTLENSCRLCSSVSGNKDVTAFSHLVEIIKNHFNVEIKPEDEVKLLCLRCEDMVFNLHGHTAAIRYHTEAIQQQTEAVQRSVTLNAQMVRDRQTEIARMSQQLSIGQPSCLRGLSPRRSRSYDSVSSDPLPSDESDSKNGQIASDSRYGQLRRRSRSLSRSWGSSPKTPRYIDYRDIEISPKRSISTVSSMKERYGVRKSRKESLYIRSLVNRMKKS